MNTLSATSIATFKSCPYRYYYRYVLGLAPIIESDSQRMGTNYHRIHEIADMKPGGPCECQQTQCAECELCQSTGKFPGNPMDAVIRHLDKAYATAPVSKTLEEWEVEKIILLYSLIGYQWYYGEQDAEYTVESLEQKFRIPLLSPITGRKLAPELIGKIDRLFSAGTNRFVHDYKSTSKNVEPDSTFWNHLTLDTQTRLYTYAAARMDLGLCGVLYDAWHKPQISPKNLTQGDSAKFVEDGIYCGEKFEIQTDLQAGPVTVNNKITEVEPGKKPGTFAIRETPEMFGARLLQDITTRPAYYFARREVAHTTEDIKTFEWELFNIYSSIRMMANKNTWWRNEQSCENTYKCDYINFCYNNIVVGPDEVPDNFRKVV
jgi:ATP-dependent helicase/DNAse subunit B